MTKCNGSCNCGNQKSVKRNKAVQAVVDLLPETQPLLKFYAVRNKEGLWFRAKGYGGSGESWVKEITRAKIYARSGGARGTVTFFAKAYPQYGVPDLVELHVTQTVVVDESVRVAKSIKKAEIAQKEGEIRDLERRMTVFAKYESDIQGLRVECDRIKKELGELKK